MYGIFESASPYPYDLFLVQEGEDREPIQFPKPITEEMMRSASM